MVLDDRKEIVRLDPGGMLGLVQRLGTMTTDGWEAASDLALPPVSPSAVIVGGMGGSGIGGDLLRALLAPTAALPVVVVKDYRLPAFVGRDTLVFACSYSGDTEETLAAYQEAHASGAAIVAVTSGGALADHAAASGHPVVRVPPGLPPRAALPYMLMPLLRITGRLGIGGVTDSEVREAAALLDGLVVRWGPEAPSGVNPAKSLAAALEGALPVVYASSSLFEPVAQRWKTQLNENSKVFACWNAFPELNHNETVGWEGVRGGHPRLHAVLLRDRDEGARNALRVEITRELLARRADGVTEVWSQGNGLLARLLSLVLLGDLVSVYLAVLTRVDPTPVEIIAEIKRRLGGG
ncbi:MAG: bifunctional phosphoglucose/phosphomannose isomerase [bacterium]|nr:bifunctional phosphoglucose/phosphomannose isomerase [bacterium]